MKHIGYHQSIMSADSMNTDERECEDSSLKYALAYQKSDMVETRQVP